PVRNEASCPPLPSLSSCSRRTLLMTPHTGDIMNAPPLLSPAPRRAPVFTLGSALHWLGQDCADRRCAGPTDILPASGWFIPPGQLGPTGSGRWAYHGRSVPLRHACDHRGVPPPDRGLNRWRPAIAMPLRSQHIVHGVMVVARHIDQTPFEPKMSTS